MRSERNTAALEAIRDNIGLARSFLGSLDHDAFVRDQKSTYAVVRCLEIISEASRRLDADLKSRHPSIPWEQIAGAGNVYRHEYDNVLATYVWNTVSRSLPPLLEAVIEELERQP